MVTTHFQCFFSFVGQQELIDSSSNGANEFISSINFDRDDNITAASNMTLNAATQQNFDRNLVDENITGNKESLFGQTKNYKEHVFKKTAVPNVKSNIDNTNKNFSIMYKKN
ncbi:hypothetical protein COBT_001612 [Conglomerata obtusa]